MNITQNNAGMTVVQKIQMDSCTAILLHISVKNLYKKMSFKTIKPSENVKKISSLNV